MVKVVILGSTGMLGNAVSKVLLKNKNLKIFTSYRKKEYVWDSNSFYFDAMTTRIEEIPDCDYLINCIGIIKPYMLNGIGKSVYVNSVFPHKLAKYCTQKNIKMIHITTDCVYSGQEGKYNENSLHDCLDEYGKSKSLGETEECMTIRTSIIGEEIHSNSSLIEWIKSMKGQQINGFTNHLWNGITTTQYGEICQTIIENSLHQPGLFHVHSNDVTKFELATIVNDVYDLGITINEFETKNACDRTLRTTKGLNKILKVPELRQQIIKMKKINGDKK